MAYVRQSQPRGPLDYGPTSFSELLLGFGFLGGIAVGIYLLFHLPLLFSYLGQLGVGVLIGPLGLSVWEMLAAIALGMTAGMVVGAMRGRQLDNLVLEELVGAVLSPEVVTTASVRWSNVALAVVVGLGSGLLVARLGLTGLDEHGFGTVAGPVLIQGCLWFCSGGSGGGPLLVALAAIALVVFFLTVLFSVGIAAMFAAVGKGLVTGAAQGSAHAFGIALVLSLTRLRTTTLANTSYGPPGRLSFEMAYAVPIALRSRIACRDRQSLS